MFLKTLSGRFLLLTIVFVMLAEVLIFVPSVARFRVDYLQERLERAQIAALAVLATTNDMVDPALEAELLDNAGVLNVVLRRDDMRELVLSSPMPAMVEEDFDLRSPSAMRLIVDAMRTLFAGGGRVIRVMGAPVKGAGTLIEVTLEEGPLRAAMIDYGLRILQLSAAISVITALLLFLAVRALMVRPIERLVRHIKAFEAAPGDARRIIRPNATVREIREAEEALASMERQLSQALRQRERLAALGEAVSKISHDLRNMLTTMQLLVDRIETSEDPRVARLAPKLEASLRRAVKLCESTLAFGKAEEGPPQLEEFDLHALVEDVVEAERLVAEGEAAEVRFEIADFGPMVICADPDQIFRVLSNLVRNAREAVVAAGGGSVRIEAEESADGWSVIVRDTGPGLPPRARQNLFKPFSGKARAEGTGLGLAISAELVANHGGRLELLESSEKGTAFRVWLPRPDSP